MKAILLAGGQGRRLRSITGKLPKPMVPLVGVPVLDRLLELLRRNGFTDVCATLCYRPEAIQEHCGDGSSYGVHLRYRIETEPRGTAGAVRACSDFYGRDDFLVISGDAACSFDLLQLYRQHQSSGAAVTVALFPDAEPLQYGLVLQDRQGYVRHFIEKPDWPHVVTDLVNTGIYIVSPRAMTYVPEDTPFDFANDLFPLLLAADETRVQYVLHRSDDLPLDMGDLCQAVNAALGGKGGGRGALAQGSAPAQPALSETVVQLRAYLAQRLKSL